MNSHSVLDWIAVEVLVIPPQETKVVAMDAINLYLMEHRLDVAHEGYSFLLESTQDASEVVGKVWTL